LVDNQNTEIRISAVRKRMDRTQYIVRSMRLSTGLILLGYATSHFISHSFGIRSIAAMDTARSLLIDPWQTSAGLVALYGSFVIHGLLGLFALYRRRHLRMPASEAWQLALGLSIPLLLIPHAAGVRVGYSFFGMEFGYAALLHQMWIVSPGGALPRQLALLLVVWVHGCIGLRSWLRSAAWYHRALPIAASIATLLPVLAILGVINAGLDLREAVQNGALAAGAAAPAAESLNRIVDRLSISYLGLIVAVLVLRVARDWHAKRYSSVRILYPGGKAVSVPVGLSVLEASRWAGIAHESVCGGRGRCSTCRIRILQGADTLSPPDELELRTLRRIHAAPDVRLACQMRPAGDLAVELLVHPRPADDLQAIRFDAAASGGQEVDIAAMFVDLRGSTELAAGRLPFDALFILDRFIQVVTSGIRAHGGRVTSIAGDGIMSVFSVDGQTTARQALRAALAIWQGLDALNTELASELPRPLRIGMGLHVGPSVVGWISDGASQSLQFLGDTGNVAAKLEGHAKECECTLVVSAAAIASASLDAASLENTAVKIAGRGNPMSVALVRRRADLEKLLALDLAA
jgi:adenylate cyclase